MRTPDQDERPEAGAAGDALGDGFGTVDQADLADGYGTTDFYDDSYGHGDGDGDGDAVDPDDAYETDDTFDDAPDDDGGFGSTGDDVGLGEGDGDGIGEVVPVGSEAEGTGDSEAESILEEILDDVFGDETGEVIDDMESSSGMDAGEILDVLGGEDDGGLGGPDASDGGVFDNPFDGSDGALDVADAPDADVADFVTESDFDLNTDGHVDHGDLREAAHPFDFHVDGG